MSESHDSSETASQNIQASQGHEYQKEKATSKTRHLDGSMMMSILALVISTVFAGYNIFDQFQERKASRKADKLEELRTISQELADTRAEVSQAYSTNGENYYGFATFSSAKNVKRALLLESANAIINEFPHDVSAQVFLSLGYEYSSQGRYAETLSCFDRGLSVSENDLTSKVWLLCGIGNLFMAPSYEHFSTDSGQSYYMKAEGLVRNRNDYFSKYLLTSIHLALANYRLFLNSDTAGASNFLLLSDSETSRLGTSSPNYSDLRIQSRTLHNAIDGNYLPYLGYPPPSAVVGRWNIYSSGKCVGSMLCSLGLDKSSYGISYQKVQENGSLSELGTGSIIPLDSSHVKYMWAGTNGTVYRNGSAILTLSTDAKRWFGTLRTLQGDNDKVVLVRP